MMSWRLLPLKVITLLIILVGCSQSPTNTLDTVTQRDPSTIVSNLRTTAAAEVTTSIETAVGAPTVVFGAEDFVRLTGKPEVVSRTFTAIEGSYEFRLVNGPSDFSKSTSGVIKINGQTIVSSNALKESVDEIVQTVNLLASNEISVSLKGKPGSAVNISLTSEKPLPNITGQVVTTAGIAIDNAEVSVSFVETGQVFTVNTASDGTFDLGTLPTDGLYLLSAISANGGTSAVGILSEDATQATATLAVSPVGAGLVSGTVLDDSGNSVNQAVITAIFPETGFTSSSFSSVDGSYSLENLPPDGTLILLVSDLETSTSAAEFTVLSSSQLQNTVSFDLGSQQTVNQRIENSQFNYGTLDGWTTEGSVTVHPRSEYFPELETQNLGQLETQAAGDYAAVVSTAGNDIDQANTSQTFYADSCQTHLTGKIRFLSDEWPQYFGTEFNDAFVVTLFTAKGQKPIASGNLNSSSWSSGLGGFIGKTPIIEISEDISLFAGTGQPIQLTFSASDVGDKIIDSGVALTDLKFVDNSLGTQALTSQAVGLEDVNLQISPVTSWVLPDDAIPTDVITPYVYETDKGRIVVIRQSDVSDGEVSFTVPVKAVDDAGQLVLVNSTKYFSFPNVKSSSVTMTNGIANIVVTVPVGQAGFGEIDLRDVTLTPQISPNGFSNSSLGTQAITPVPVDCQQEVSLEMDIEGPGNGLPPNKQFSEEDGQTFAEWFGDTDWETKKLIFQLGYDTIPLVGDGTEILKQLISGATGQGIDGISFGLASVGFLLDLPTDGGTLAAGVIVSGARTIYDFSKKADGLLAEEIEEILTGGFTPREVVEYLTDTFGNTADLLAKGGADAIENADKVAKALKNAGANTTNALDGIKDGIDYADSIGVPVGEFLELATKTTVNADKVPLSQVADWLGNGRLTKLSDDVYESTEGIKYGLGSVEGHRIAHVLKHTKPANLSDIGTNGHGIFNSNEEILSIIDEAWKKKKLNNIQGELDDPIAYVVQMDRTVGRVQYSNGSNIITDTIRVVVKPDGSILSAYPYRP